MTAATLVLWEHPMSPFAQKVKIALREKGLVFEARTPAGFGSGAADAEFARLSPFGEVPVLVDGELAIFDSTIILEYLEAKHPKPDLVSDHPPLGAKARMIEEVCDTRLDAALWGAFEVLGFGRVTGQAGEAVLARAQADIAAILAWLEPQLAGQWFCQPHFGLADLSVAPLMAAAIGAGIGPAPGSPLLDWFARAQERPSVSATLAEARAAHSKSAALAPQALTSGGFKRAYHAHRLEWMLRAGGVDVVASGLEAGTIRLGPDLVSGAHA